jgi:hypothetical protein
MSWMWIQFITSWMSVCIEVGLFGEYQVDKHHFFVIYSDLGMNVVLGSVASSVECGNGII